MSASTYLNDKIHAGTSVIYHLRVLRPWLDRPGVTEICVNRPFEVWVEEDSIWTPSRCEELTYDKCLELATAVAGLGRNEVSDVRPIMSSVLPDGERIQIVMPPACERGTISLTIRKPSMQIRTMEQYREQGFFKHVQKRTDGLTQEESELLKLHQNGQYEEFCLRAVDHGKVIIVSGPTGTGKTTFMKTLVQRIRASLRLITIEDVPELGLPNHPNHVHLFYPSEAKEEENAIVTPASLLRSCFRMKPDRILLAELRGGEAFDFVNGAASGHSGSISSVHGGSKDLAFERLTSMILQNRQGRTLSYDVIQRLLHQVIDVVIQVNNDIEFGNGRHISEIWFDPAAKYKKAI